MCSTKRSTMDEFIVIISLFEHIEPTTQAARVAQASDSLNALQYAVQGLYANLIQLLKEDFEHPFEPTELSEKAMELYRRRAEGSYGKTLVSYCSYVNEKEEFHDMLSKRGFGARDDVPELDSS